MSEFPWSGIALVLASLNIVWLAWKAIDASITYPPIDGEPDTWTPEYYIVPIEMNRFTTPLSVTQSNTHG